MHKISFVCNFDPTNKGRADKHHWSGTSKGHLKDNTPNTMLKNKFVYKVVETNASPFDMVLIILPFQFTCNGLDQATKISLKTEAISGSCWNLYIAIRFK